MSVLSDIEIIQRCVLENMIEPYEGATVREVNGKKVISYGVSGYGYDIRVADEFKLLYRDVCEIPEIIDPKDDKSVRYASFKASIVEIPPNSMLLCRSVEKFKIPRDIMCMAVGKSTYARCGLIVNITPLEPEWEGYLTIEVSNTTPLAVKVYANEGIAQLLFFKATTVCGTSYADKGGKYQSQTGVQEAKL